jgi:ABC-2 type transport system permease protein
MNRFFSDLWLLLRLRWTISFNTFRGRKWWQQVLQIIGVVWVAGWLGFLSGLVGFGVGSLLRRYPDSGLDALLPGLILTAVALIILLSSFAVALGALFLTSDLETLMTAPVSRRAVFTAKILDGLTTYYAIVLITAVPALITYGFGLRYGPLYYLLALIAVLGTPLLPAGLGALLTMLVARFAPARRVREVLGLVGAIVGIGFSLIGQISRIWSRRFAEAGNDPAVLLDGLHRIALVPLPSIVAGRGLAAAGNGQWLTAFAEIAGFLVLTFGIFTGCVLVADRLYAVGWARMQSAGSANRSRARVARDAANAGWLGRAPAWAAIALKDWRVIPRDLRNFAQLLTPLVILPIVYINLLGGNGGRRSRDLTSVFDGVGGANFDPAGMLIAIGILFATVLIFRRVASNAISMEGTAWWILKIAPIPPRELLRGKLAAAFIPFAILSTVLLIGAEIWKRFNILGFAYGWLGIQLLGAAILATAIGASAPWARLDWDDPKKMSSGWGSLISLITGIATAGLAGIALCLPIAATAFAPNLTVIAWLIGPLLAIAIVAATVWASVDIGARFLAKVGEA